MVAERRERLIVFAKSAQPGTVKTRLIPALGADGAAHLHSVLLERTLSIASRWEGGEIELHTTDVDDASMRGLAVRWGAKLAPQSAGDLGERMLHAFIAAFEIDGCTAVVLIGGDCAVLSPGYLARAFELLRNHDAVFGPAEDGGYVLVGLTRATPDIFTDMAWSDSTVMTETRTRLTSLGWLWAELETLWDVDGPADYERLQRTGGIPPACK